MTAVSSPLYEADTVPGSLPDAESGGEDQSTGEQLRQALRQHPAGVAVVTAGEWRRPVGLTVTSFTSVSLSPALVSLLVARSASVWPAFEQSTRIGIHLLPAHARELATTFARSSADRFAPPTCWTPDVHGVPVLHDAGVRLSCVVQQLIPVGDHVLVVARVESVHHPEGTHLPLAWHDGGFAGIVPVADRAR